MKYTIITPTICRASLLDACKSIDQQTDGDWEHIIMVDKAGLPFNLNSIITQDPRRRVVVCGESHADGGSTCRHNAWEYATGEYMLYLDDDNFYADANVFATLRSVKEDWALFPLLYKGTPTIPSISNVDTNNIMHRRIVGRFPIQERGDSEHWIKNGDQRLVSEQLINRKLQIIESRPLVIYTIEGNHA